jgi:hypothetical protein
MLLALLLCCTIGSAAEAQPATPERGPSKCFFANQFEGWKAPDDKTLFIRVTPHRYFRLDLAGTCSSITFPGSHLVTVFHGSDAVCTALDWDLKVVQSPHGIAEACIVKSMKELTPEEAAAIPPRFHP